jgi:hypothetical protein
MVTVHLSVIIDQDLAILHGPPRRRCRRAGARNPTPNFAAGPTPQAPELRFPIVLGRSLRRRDIPNRHGSRGWVVPHGPSSRCPHGPGCHSALDSALGALWHGGLSHTEGTTLFSDSPGRRRPDKPEPARAF